MWGVVLLSTKDPNPKPLDLHQKYKYPDLSG